MTKDDLAALSAAEQKPISLLTIGLMHVPNFTTP